MQGFHGIGIFSGDGEGESFVLQVKRDAAFEGGAQHGIVVLDIP